MSSGGNKGEAPQSKKAKAAKPARAAGEAPGRAVRILVSFVLALHVFVLFLYPLANSRTSTTVRAVAQSPWIRWYADPLYLNHGHGFFGPDPGAGFIVEYQVHDDRGEVVAEGKFPDAERIWPRLRYHRFKMLADQLETPLPDATVAERRRIYMLQRYAHQLIRQYDGERATVTQVMHSIVPHNEWLGDEQRGIEPKALDDKSLYRELKRVTQTRADVEAADAQLLRKAEAAPEPEGSVEVVPGGAVQ